MRPDAEFTRMYPWPRPNASPETLRLDADEFARGGIAHALDLESVEEFHAELAVSPWLDGVEIQGRLLARVVRLCGLTLDPFDVTINESINLKAVPPGSPNLPAPPEPDAEIDLEGEDPPEAYGAEGVDLGAILVETLALGLDPFPRKPGAVFKAPSSMPESSPFQILADLTKSQTAKG